MAVRRIWINETRAGERPLASFDGIAGESGETEMLYPYGLASGRSGSGLLLEIQDDPDNHAALPPRGDRTAHDATVLYWNETTIELTDDRIELTLPGGAFLRLTANALETNVDIRTTGDVVAGNTSLRTHTHSGVQTGGGVSGPPV